MSVAEIIDELRHLSVEERKEIARALLALEDELAGKDVRLAMDAVFQKHRELLRRLAT